MAYVGERFALDELASVIRDDVIRSDRWAIDDWIRREMRAAGPEQVMELIDRASAEFAADASNDADCGTILNGLNSLRSRSQELVSEQLAARGTCVDDAIEALHSMVRVVDPGLHEHLEAAGTLAGRIALSLGLDRDDVGHVTAAARLCDVGAIGSQVGSHSQRGERILETIPVLSQYHGWIRSHHEYLDGSGTPDGLAEADIPFEVRIVTVADDFHSMVAAGGRLGTRPMHEALAHLRRYSGLRYDGRPVAALEEIVAPRRRLGSPTAA